MTGFGFASSRFRPIPFSAYARRGGGYAQSFSRRVCVRALQKALHETPRTQAGVERREAPGSWPRHASECRHALALRARRAPQDDPLARTACFGRAAPPGAPPRSGPGAVDRHLPRTALAIAAALTACGWMARRRFGRQGNPTSDKCQDMALIRRPMLDCHRQRSTRRRAAKADYPRSIASCTGPSNNAPISFNAAAARSALQPPCWR